MAVSPTSYLSSKIEASRPSLSCPSKICAGLKAQSRNCIGAKPSSNVEFRNKVYKSIEAGSRNGNPTRGRITMMPLGTPRVHYRNNIEGTWQWLDLWNALYRERVIFMGSYVNEEYSNTVLATMLYLDTLGSSDKIYIYMNCPGGDLTPCMSIYDTMQSLSTGVGTVNIAFAYDMAAFILAAGEKGYRGGMPLSRVGLMSPAGSARGQADHIRNEADELLRIRDYLFKELAQKTGQPEEKIHKDLSRVMHFTAQEALEYGIIDKLIRPAALEDDGPYVNPNKGLG